MVLAPKKSDALQERQGPSIAALSAGQMPPVVAPVPLASQADTGAKGAPSEVTEQPASEVILLSMLKRAELLLMLVASSVVGIAPPVEAPLTQMKVAVTVTSQA